MSLPDALSLFLLAASTVIALLLRLQFPQEEANTAHSTEEDAFLQRNLRDPLAIGLPLTGLGDIPASLYADGGFLPPEAASLLRSGREERGDEPSEMAILTAMPHPMTSSSSRAIVRLYWGLTTLIVLTGLILMLIWAMQLGG